VTSAFIAIEDMIEKKRQYEHLCELKHLHSLKYPQINSDMVVGSMSSTHNQKVPATDTNENNTERILKDDNDVQRESNGITIQRHID
jgi:hypothetical protein